MICAGWSELGMFSDTDASSVSPPPRSDRLVALFLVGVMALNPPLLRAFGVDGTVFGFPLLVFYVFVVWGLLIGLAAWHVERGDRGDRGERSPRMREEDLD